MPIDASHIGYTANDPANWENGKQPGDVDDALDQLAAETVFKRLFNARTLLYALSDDTPSAISAYAATRTMMARGFGSTVPTDVAAGENSVYSRFGSAEIAANAASDDTILAKKSGSALAFVVPDTLRSMLGIVVARKTSDETVNNSDSVQDDDELTLSLEASTNYIISGLIIYSSSTVADIRQAFTIPSGASMNIGSVSGVVITNRELRYIEYDGSGTEEFNFGENVGIRIIQLLQGTVQIGTTAGNLLYRWGQWAAEATDTVVHSGSFLKAEAY